MKKRNLLFCLALMAAVAAVAEPFFVRVNGTDDYLASPTGEVDFQGRTQYAAMCVPLKAGDNVLCYDKGNEAVWSIQVVDEGETWGAKGFSADAQGLHCTIDGNYDMYIKLMYEDDCWYIGGPNTDCTPAKPYDPSTPTPDPGYTTSAPAQYPGVMLQAFYWDSYQDKGYGRTKWFDFIKVADGQQHCDATEIGQWFDLVWLPPSAKSMGGTGYLPIQYSNQNSTGWGNKDYLVQLIDTLHLNGARVVADMVMNHIASSSGWCTFAKQNFGEYGVFEPTAAWICNTDEMNYDSNAGDCKGSATGGADDGYGSEANYEAGRDWDHNQQQVRNMLSAYAKWMINVIGYDGFRYDYCKGFHNSHINEYNTNGQAFFSVMEMWDGNPDALMSHLNDANWNTTTFDFGTKYAAFNNGIAADNYYGCKGAGLLGRGKGRYAVTFVDSHDSFQRDDNEFCGKGNSMKYKDKLMQCNAYILAMPGTPCIFYPHWVTFKADLKKLINARYKTGVHNESAVSDEAGNGYYKATITGTNGEIRLLLGPNSGYASTPSGFTLAAKGTNWGVYYKTNSSRGDKDKNRTPIIKGGLTQGVEDVNVNENANVKKVLRNGQLFIEVDGAMYDITGRHIQ